VPNYSGVTSLIYSSLTMHIARDENVTVIFIRVLNIPFIFIEI